MKNQYFKKGFTLVELIVVIAIIGVLAAILIPTMLGFVTNANVTSAVSTANSMERIIEEHLTTVDAENKGMLLNNTAILTISVTENNGEAVWNGTLDNPGGFHSEGSFSWQGAASVTATTDRISVSDNGTALLLSELCHTFPEIKQGYIWVAMNDGNVEALVYTAETSNGADVSDLTTAYDGNGALIPTATVDWSAKTGKIDGNNAGISANGYVCGTSPALVLG